MAEKKSEKIKIYMVIGLSLLLVTLGYFRFIHGKPNHDEAPTKPTSPSAELNIPDIKTQNKLLGKIKAPDVHEPLYAMIRDIFSPIADPKKAERQVNKELARKSATLLKLTGTVYGGKRPIAIINDQFVRTGDWIGEFRVIRIGKKNVLLDSGDKKMVLEIMKNE